MVRTVRTPAVIAALALAACQTPTEPDLAAAQPAFSAASAPIVVAGSGHIDADPTDPHDLRRFTISAIGHADGTASGQYQLTIGPAAVTAHGTVTCVSTLGNRAFIGGTIDRRNIFEEFDITGVAIEVVDNGVGGGDVSPDEVSSVGFFVANPDGPQQFCDAATPGPTMPITQGDITVR